MTWTYHVLISPGGTPYRYRPDTGETWRISNDMWIKIQEPKVNVNS